MKNIELGQLQSIYQELCRVVGLDATLSIYSSYKGQQISFPQKLFSSQYVRHQILLEYTGKNINELSQKYGYSSRWIRSIIHNQQKIHSELKSK